MKVTKRSIFTNESHTMDLPITATQLNRWQAGTLIQIAMPQLTVEQREFLITGAVGDDWNMMRDPEEVKG